MSVDVRDVDGRLLELVRQRNEALDRCAVLCGIIATLQEQVAVLQPNVKEAKSRLEAPT